MEGGKQNAAGKFRTGEEPKGDVEMQRRQRGYSESEESEDERPASRGGYSKGAKRGRPRKNLVAPPPQKKRRRKSSWQDDDEDDDDFQAAGGPSSDEIEQEKKKRRPGRPRKVPVEKAAVPKRRRQQAKEVPPLVEDGPADMMALEERHRTRKQQHELDSERLLREVRDLALAEKKTQERLIEKLKKDITTLSRQAEEERKKRTKEVDRLVEERMQKVKLKQRDCSNEDAEKVALRQHIKELEAQFASFKRSTGPDDIVTVNTAASSALMASKNSEAAIQLAQANKLLEIYRLVTSTDIRLIEAIDDDSQDPDDCTDVVCTATDSAEGKRFEFELAVPSNASSEIEYLPSEKPPTDLKVPSYLREELSFNRSEMTKFIRSVLDVVIRKKKS